MARILLAERVLKEQPAGELPMSGFIDKICRMRNYAEICRRTDPKIIQIDFYVFTHIVRLPV
jgi:hypothetical protein